MRALYSVFIHIHLMYVYNLYLYTCISMMFYVFGMLFTAVVIHKFVRDMYSKRFPELESLLHTPIEYIKTVQVYICIYVRDCNLDFLSYLFVRFNCILMSIASIEHSIS